MPRCGIPALRSALPQPAKTNQKVPRASAASRAPIVSSLPVRACRALCPARPESASGLGETGYGNDRGCQAGTKGVEYRLEQGLNGAEEELSMKEYRVTPGSPLNLDRYDPDGTGNYQKTDQGKEKAKSITAELTGQLG